MSDNEKINNEIINTPEEVEPEKEMDMEQIEDDISKKGEKVVRSGEELLQDAEKGVNLSEEEVGQVRQETGVIGKLNSIKDRIGLAAKQALRKIRVYTGVGKPISQNEEFDPEEQVSAIRQAPREGRNEKLQEFYEKYLFQKKGLSIVQEQFGKEIKKNPDIDREELFRNNEKLINKYGITTKQKDRINEILDNYQAKHEAVEDYAGEGEDASSIYEKTFGFNPQGRVDLRKGPVSVSLICHDLDDYIRAYNGGEDVSENIEKRANSTYGACINGIPGFEGDVVLINQTGIDKENDPDITVENNIVHEEQHAVNKLFYNFEHDQEDKNIKMNEAVMEKDPNKQELAMNRYLRAVREYAEVKMKDEIIARYKGGDSREETKHELLRREAEGGHYDYAEANRQGRRKQLLEIMGEGKEEFIDKCIDKVYNQELDAIIDKAVDEIYSIKKTRKYNTDFVIGLLQNEPLRKWPKVVKRFTDFYSQ